MPEARHCSESLPHSKHHPRNVKLDSNADSLTSRIAKSPAWDRPPNPMGLNHAHGSELSSSSCSCSL
eukprot:879382-Amphidinium_carterae.1